jgi:hypothetical protein
VYRDRPPKRQRYQVLGHRDERARPPNGLVPVGVDGHTFEFDALSHRAHFVGVGVPYCEAFLCSTPVCSVVFDCLRYQAKMQVVRVGGGGVFIHNLNCKRGGPGIPIESVHYHDVADERVCVSVEHPGAPFITNNE